MVFQKVGGDSEVEVAIFGTLDTFNFEFHRNNTIRLRAPIDPSQSNNKQQSQSIIVHQEEYKNVQIKSTSFATKHFFLRN